MSTTIASTARPSLPRFPTYTPSDTASIHYSHAHGTKRLRSAVYCSGSEAAKTFNRLIAQIPSDQCWANAYTIYGAYKACQGDGPARGSLYDSPGSDGDAQQPSKRVKTENTATPDLYSVPVADADAHVRSVADTQGYSDGNGYLTPPTSVESDVNSTGDSDSASDVGTSSDAELPDVAMTCEVCSVTYENILLPTSTEDYIQSRPEDKFYFLCASPACRESLAEHWKGSLYHPAWDRILQECDSCGDAKCTAQEGIQPGTRWPELGPESSVLCDRCTRGDTCSWA